MALYADSDRGRYPVWQSLDHPNFFPGSGIVFVTVTVSLNITSHGLDPKLDSDLFNVGRFCRKNRESPRFASEGRSDGCCSFHVS